MVEKQKGSLAVRELAQSLKKGPGLLCTLHRVLAAKTGAPNGSAEKDELSGRIDPEARREKVDVQVGAGTIQGRELALPRARVKPNLPSCIHKPTQRGTDVQERSGPKGSPCCTPASELKASP